MRKMNSTIIASDGLSAQFGGGILGLEVRDALWAAGKQTGKCSSLRPHLLARDAMHMEIPVCQLKD